MVEDREESIGEDGPLNEECGWEDHEVSSTGVVWRTGGVDESTREEEKDCPVLEKVSKGSWVGHDGYRQSGEGQKMKAPLPNRSGRKDS